MNKKPQDFIAGAAQVAEDYGDWPTLHDSQLLNLTIGSQAASVEATFDLLDGESPNETTILAIRWEGVTSLQLASANRDGVLYNVVFSATQGGTETQFSSKTGGVTGQIRAARIAVSHYATEK